MQLASLTLRVNTNLHHPQILNLDESRDSGTATVLTQSFPVNHPAPVRVDHGFIASSSVMES